MPIRLSLRWLVAAVAGLLLLMFAIPTQAQGCHYQFGFLAIYQQIPEIVGSCTTNEAYNALGNSEQLTANGLLQWRKADNFTAFTDGYRSWVNGPCGLEMRLNSQRFTWEANPDGLPYVPSACGAAPPANPVVPAAPTATPAPAAFIEFTVDDDRVKPGDCTTIRWRTENIDSVYFDGEGVVGRADRRICPTTETTYTLDVKLRDGTTQTQKITVKMR
jgi:hypothetical protein